MTTAKTDNQSMDDARTFSAKERKTAASSGKAMGDGSFPIKSKQDLLNAITAYGRAKDKARAKAHIIKRARALGLTSLLPNGWLKKSDASSGAGEIVTISCPECVERPREFLDENALYEHAEAVHTFDDTRKLVNEKVRETYKQKGDYKLNIPYIYCWVEDMATDWVVFRVEKGEDSTMYKASYSITDTTVTLGDPYEVVRRTLYEKVPNGKTDGTP